MSCDPPKFICFLSLRYIFNLLLGASLAHCTVYFRRANDDFLNCSCGQFTPEKRYIDGTLVVDAGFNWLVGILKKPSGRTDSPLCYGSLISDRHILTAASCVSKKTNHDIEAYFYGNDIPSIFRRRRTIKRISIHEEYASMNHDNNLAMLTLTVPVDLENSKGKNNGIYPICIPNPFVFSERLNKLKGLMTKMQLYKTVLFPGRAFYFAPVPLKIHGGRNPACSNIFSERPKDKRLCEVLNGQCYGDQGSSLTITLSETGKAVMTGGRYYLLGVYSKGYGCDGYQKGKSGVDVSTNIMNHTDWLIRKTRDGYFCS